MNTPTPKAAPAHKGLAILTCGAVSLFLLAYLLIALALHARTQTDLDRLHRNVDGMLDGAQNQLAEQAWWLATQAGLPAAITAGDTAAINGILDPAADRTGADEVILLNRDGVVIARAKGGSTGDVRRTEAAIGMAMTGRAAAGVEETLETQMVMTAAHPLYQSTQQVGTIVVRRHLFTSHVFVDSVYRDFDVVCSVFQHQTRISTTILNEGRRVIGTPLANPQIIEDVLVNGRTFRGRNTVMKRDYDTVYWPLRSVDGRVIGSVGIGRDRATLDSVFRITFAALSFTIILALFAARPRTVRLQSWLLFAMLPGLFATTAVAGYLLYRNLYQTIQDGFNRKLYALGTTAASCMDGDRMLSLLSTEDRESPLFKSFADPMRAITARKDVTYFYTFKLGGTKDIQYIVDSSTGEDYCPIGMEEESPPENLNGLRTCVERGTPYLSGILEYNRWGLLKVAAAPIYNASNHVAAINGVDIDVSIIRNKTRLAVFQVLGVAAATLVLAGLISLWMAGRLITPITRVRDGALLIAAGRYDHRITVDRPLEIAGLAAALNGVGDRIAQTVADSRLAAQQAEDAVRLVDLTRALAQHPLQAPVSTSSMSARWLGGGICPQPSGAIQCGDRLVAWLCACAPDALTAIRQRLDIATLGARLMQRTPGTWDTIRDTILNTFPGSIEALLQYDAARRELDIRSEKSWTAHQLDAAGRVQRITLEGTRRRSLAPGEWLIISISEHTSRAGRLLEGGWKPALPVVASCALADQIEAALRDAGGGDELLIVLGTGSQA